MRCEIDDYSAYRSAERAELYDAVYANVGDVGFWEDVAAGAEGGPLLELGCGTGRLLLPLARAGHNVVGLDLAYHMLARCRKKLAGESTAVRDRVELVRADMTTFRLDRRFAQIYCPFGSFHHLRTVEEQFACLEACRDHLAPDGTLILDLVNPDPAPRRTSSETTTGTHVIEPIEMAANGDIVEWTDGRRIRSWATVVGGSRSLQVNDCEVTYEILEADGTSRRVTETFPMRFVFRYELEHLLARCGFRVDALYGDYDRSAFADESLGMIVFASSPGVRTC